MPASSSNSTLRQLPGSGETGPLAFLLCDNTQDVALCQKRALERHCRRKGLFSLFLLWFSLFFFPTGGYPVVHTFPYYAQDRPQSSDHLTAVCPMQKPLTTNFQHFIHQYPSACTLGGYFCPETVDQLWLREIHIYIYIFCHSMESNHTFPMKSESKLCGQGLSFCVYSSFAYSLSSLKSSLECSLYHCNHSPLINNNSLNVPCSNELCFCRPAEFLLIQLHVQIYKYIC